MNCPPTTGFFTDLSYSLRHGITVENDNAHESIKWRYTHLYRVQTKPRGVNMTRTILRTGLLAGLVVLSILVAACAPPIAPVAAPTASVETQALPDQQTDGQAPSAAGETAASQMTLLRKRMLDLMQAENPDSAALAQVRTQMETLMGQMQGMMGQDFDPAAMNQMMAMMSQMTGMMGQMQGMMGEGMPGPTMMNTPEAGAQPTPHADMTRSAEAGAVSVDVTPLNLFQSDASSLDFEIALNTHSVDLGADLAQLAVVRIDGREIAATAWEPSASGGHHVSGLLRFPALAEGPNSVTLIIRNLANVPERSFTWELSDN
ncbi:MAG: hypothetical protein KIS63_05365 [Caldilineales bacterium]|nr:hypothetical protein [Caldilineales bacterium]